MNNLPLLIEIEINSNCNLACSYCPNSIDGYSSSREMDLELYTKLLLQLKEKGYKGKLAFDFYNEPMDTPNFDRFVELAKKTLPSSFLSLYSNGTKILNKDRLVDIIDKGICEIVITKHEAIKKLPIESFYDDLELSIKSKVSIRDYQNLVLTNRSGSLKVGEKGDFSKHSCSVPSLMFTVTVDGDVLPCFEDAYRKHSLGNIKSDNVIDIWNSKDSHQFRCDLKTGQRQKYEICKDCNRLDADNTKLNRDKHFLGDEEIVAISQVLRSGNLFRYQSNDGLCTQFEKAMANKLGTSFAHLVTSGTNALVCALVAAGISPGDEVIIPSYTFVATATAVLICGGIPIIAEVDHTLLIDISSIKGLISERTKAIIPVHMDGLCCDMDSIMEISKQNNLKVIEDAAQAKGGLYKGRYLGTIGDFGCFSYNKDKILTAGEGGLVITNSRENYEKLCLISDGAFSFSPHHSNFFKHQSPFLGFSMRVSEITGAILGVQLEKMDRILERYKHIKEIFNMNFINNSLVRNSCGHDPQGECNINIMLECDGPNVASILGNLLRERRIIAAPPSIRPAHVAWKWAKLLKKDPFLVSARNPYLLTDKKYNYNSFNYLNSINNVARTVRIEIDIHWSDEEITKVSELINEAVEITKRSISEER
ncbi:aminotransferase class I/II-fold pyridoxal phosphate-dependent enzyme [Halobacteriovorax sp. HLS]|uniref:aminotransferase class I/II-fold pyridoxal phosphate-dependent enzyme n=1 Tax=Halobacteriovorax sp. HLS TaxID=2234000 RepID=UPI000FD73B14|nr:aminotransferase class I/II-fold pyridoxal phosphate-dependent enzyme [Halobacteriovorax sp. HLS]